MQKQYQHYCKQDYDAYRCAMVCTLYLFDGQAEVPRNCFVGSSMLWKIRDMYICTSKTHINDKNLIVCIVFCSL